MSAVRLLVTINNAVVNFMEKLAPIKLALITVNYPGEL